jgi:hypothetical protein
MMVKVFQLLYWCGKRLEICDIRAARHQHAVHDNSLPCDVREYVIGVGRIQVVGLLLPGLAKDPLQILMGL